MSSIVLFLLLSQTAPPQDYIGKLPNLPLHQPRHIQDQQYANLFDKGTCFTMRSYVFTRQDGNAPVLVGTSTCTPASALRMEESKHRHGELILAPAGKNPR
jgi:hypothetical protein